MRVIELPSSTLLLVASLVLPAAHAAQDALMLGQPLSVALPAADTKSDGLDSARVLTFVPNQDETLTVTVESCAGDVIVRSLGAGDTVLDKDDNGLVATNALLVLNARKSEMLRLSVAFRVGGPGSAIVTLRAGNVAPPQGPERASAEARYWVDVVQVASSTEATAGARDELAKALAALKRSAQLDYNAGSYATSRAQFESLGELSTKVGDAELARLTRCYLACIEGKSGDSAKAIVLLGSAVEEAATAGEAEAGMMLNSVLGPLLRARGHLEEAESALRRALVAVRTLPKKNPANETIILTQLSGLASARGDRGRARNLVDEAVNLAESSGDGDSLARTLRQRAELLLETGECVAAELDLRRALDKVKSPGMRGRLLGTLGMAERSLEKYGAAKSHLDEARALAQSQHDTALEGSVLLGLAELSRSLGQLESATEAVQQALPLLPSVGQGRNRVSALLVLGALAAEAGDPARDRELCEQALALARMSGDSSAEVLALNGLGLQAWAAGDPMSALTHAIEGVSRARETGQTTLLADLLGLQAYALLRQGSPTEARKPAEESLAILRPLQDPARLPPSLTTLAEIALAEHDLTAAAAALAEVEALVNRPDVVLDPEQASGRRSRAPAAACGQLEQDLAWQRLLAAKADTDRRQILDESLASAGRWKGRGLLEGLQLRDAAARDALGELSAGTAGRLQPLVSPAKGAVDRALAVIGPDGVLVEFVEGIDDLYAYVLRDGTAKLLDLGPRSQLQPMVDEFVASLAQPPGLTAAPPSPVQLAADGVALYSAVLAKALEGVADKRRLVIVPSASVAALPFEALVVKPASAAHSFRELDYVLDHHAVSYAPSTPVLELLAAAGPRATKGRALVLGDPVFDGPAAGGAPRGARHPWLASLSPLPGTREEAQGIADRLAPMMNGDASESLVDLCLGEQADLTALAGNATVYSLVHFATHGLVDLQDSRRTGLAFAAHGDDDGFLSLGEVLGLSLNADLVVLSACSTARGRERRGEGTQSMARAFLYAGARSVVSSQWQVDDRETEKFMLAFYDGFTKEQLAAGPALHAAQVALRNGVAAPDCYRGVGRRGSQVTAPPKVTPRDLSGHPYFWAAFVYVGSKSLHPLAGH